MHWSWDLHEQNKLVSKRQESSRGQNQGPRTGHLLQCPIEILSADTRNQSPARLCVNKEPWEDWMDQWSGSKQGRPLTTGREVLQGPWEGVEAYTRDLGKCWSPGRLWRQSSFIVVDGQGPEFPARDRSRVSFTWLWKCS